MDVSLASPDSLIVPEWQDLARRALVPSGHNAPELVLPGLRARARARLATVRDHDGLQLAFPLLACHSPLPFHASLSTAVSFYGLPHLGRYAAVPALTALLRHLGEPVLLHGVPMDGVMWEALAASAPRLAVLSTAKRAVLRPQGSYAEWFESNFDRKRRKEFRRLHSRLSEQGRFEAVALAPDGDAEDWTGGFLNLESRGWKGRSGTALKADAAAGAALHEGLAGLHRSGKLRFWKLALDGKPIAMMFAIVEGREAWLGKIAYDEEYARFSPGVQLVLEATAALFAEAVDIADSCAIPDHPMIDRLWRGRRPVADVMLAGPTVPGPLFKLTVETLRLRRKARAAARNLYYRLAGRRPS